MFNPSRFLQVHGADPVRWAQRFELMAFEAPCQGCGVVVTPSLPFATADGCRGLMTRCECGHIGAPYSITSAPGALDILDARRYRRLGRRLQPVPRS